MVKVLFVCLGNICRSPAAEGVFIDMVKKEGLQDKISVDSAGTSAYHAGERADSRMIDHAEKRGIDLPSRSRKILFPKDFDAFDYIVVMDDSNYRNVEALDREGQYRSKIHKMTDFAKNCPENEVPDPYYGGAQGFERVLDIVTDGSVGLLAHIKSQL